MTATKSSVYTAVEELKNADHSPNKAVLNIIEKNSKAQLNYTPSGILTIEEKNITIASTNHNMQPATIVGVQQSQSYQTLPYGKLPFGYFTFFRSVHYLNVNCFLI